MLDLLYVPSICDANGNRLEQALLLDDPQDRNFIDFIRGGGEAFEIDLSALTFHVVLGILSPYGYRSNTR